MSDDAVADQIFAIGPQIRYVAFGKGQDVVLRERSGLSMPRQASLIVMRNC
jgi:hypothetical protein